MREGRIDVDAQSTATLIYGVKPPRRGRFEFGQTARALSIAVRLVWCQMNVSRTGDGEGLSEHAPRARSGVESTRRALSCFFTSQNFLAR